MHGGRLAVASAGGGVGATVAALASWVLAHYQGHSHLSGNPASPPPQVVFEHGLRVETCADCVERCGLNEENHTVSADNVGAEEVWSWRVLGIRIEVGINRQHREVIGAFTVGLSLHRGGSWIRGLISLGCEFLGRLPEIFGPVPRRARGRYDVARLGN